jgi:hypothetical protein
VEAKETKEERAARKQRAIQEAVDRYPPASLHRAFPDGRHLYLTLEPGDGKWVIVKGAARNTTAIYLDNLSELAEFIHALVCRYNAMAAEANEDAAACRMTPLEPINTAPAEPGDDGDSSHLRNNAPGKHLKVNP